MKNILRKTVCVLSATSLLFGTAGVAFADGTEYNTSTYPATEISALIDNYCSADASLPSFGVTNAIDEYVMAIVDTDLVATVSQVKDEYKTIVIAQVDGYLNIRQEASVDSEIVGTLQNNSAANIIGVVGDWYKITSGTVTGYVMKEYVIFGKSAETLAEQIATKTGTVNADALNIRSYANKDATVVDAIPEGESCKILSEEGEWCKVSYGDSKGYVMTQYLDITVDMETAESKNEEATRLAAEEAAYMADIAKYSSSSSAAYSAADAADSAARRARTIADGDSTEKTLSNANAAEYSAALAYGYADQKAEEEREAEERRAQIEREAAEAARREEEARQQHSSSSSGSGSSSGASSSNKNNYSSAESFGNASKGQQIANYALQFVGNPYVWGGTSLTNGADCSGFVKSVMRDCGISVAGRTSAAQSNGGTTISESQLQPGDLIFYASGGRVYHVAIYIGNQQVVHAASSSLGICVSYYKYATPYKYVRYH